MNGIRSTPTTAPVVMMGRVRVVQTFWRVLTSEVE
jgi:hypothetical protein